MYPIPRLDITATSGRPAMTLLATPATQSGRYMIVGVSGAETLAVVSTRPTYDPIVFKSMEKAGEALERIAEVFEEEGVKPGLMTWGDNTVSVCIPVADMFITIIDSAAEHSRPRCYATRNDALSALDRLLPEVGGSTTRVSDADDDVLPDGTDTPGFDTNVGGCSGSPLGASAS